MRLMIVLSKVDNLGEKPPKQNVLQQAEALSADWAA
jgi:hypothetical protein